MARKFEEITAQVTRLEQRVEAKAETTDMNKAVNNLREQLGERTSVGDVNAALARLAITPRELEILELIAMGLSTREIADGLFVSVNTVKTHSARVFEKLAAKRRTQAVLLGQQAGIIP